MRSCHHVSQEMLGDPIDHPSEDQHATRHRHVSHEPSEAAGVHDFAEHCRTAQHVPTAMITLWQACFIWMGIYWASVAAKKESVLAVIIGSICFYIGACWIK